MKPLTEEAGKSCVEADASYTKSGYLLSYPQYSAGIHPDCTRWIPANDHAAMTEKDGTVE